MHLQIACQTYGDSVAQNLLIDQFKALVAGLSLGVSSKLFSCVLFEMISFTGITEIHI